MIGGELLQIIQIATLSYEQCRKLQLSVFIIMVSTDSLLLMKTEKFYRILVEPRKFFLLPKFQ